MSTPSGHRQNAVTWFTLGTCAFVVSMFVLPIVSIVAGFASLIFGGVEVHRHRKAKTAGQLRRKPKLKTRLKKQARNSWHGEKQGGKADYKRKHPKPPKPQQPETTPKGKCSVRCRRSANPVETCECVCKGKRHGSEAR